MVEQYSKDRKERRKEMTKDVAGLAWLAFAPSLLWLIVELFSDIFDLFRWIKRKLFNRKTKQPVKPVDYDKYKK